MLKNTERNQHHTLLSWQRNTVSLISHYEICSLPLKNTWFRIFTIEENIKRFFPKLRDKAKSRQFLIYEKQSNVHKQPDILQYLFWCFTPSLEKISARCRSTPSILNCHHKHSAPCLTHHSSFSRSKVHFSKQFSRIYVMAIIVVNSLKLSKDNL